MPAAIRLDRIHKSFTRGVTVLDDVSLEVAPEEHLAILGPSGSGKSTLLRIIAGLENPDSGTVTLNGVDQANLAAHQRDVAIVFQNFALYPHLDSLNNITLGLRHGLGLNRADAQQRAREVAERMRVGHLLSRKPREMSGGQRQRIALARALAKRASVVLLDEPMSGLDAQLHVALRVEISELLRREHATGVTVTHDQLDAMAMADRIALMRDGRIEQIGTPDELYAQPASSFVASFVGSPPMNLVTLDPADGSCAFGRMRTVGDQVPRLSETLTLGVRPEAIMIGETSIDQAWRFSGEVVLVEPHGSERIVHVSCEGQVFTVRCANELRPSLGERLELWCHPDQVHVFVGEKGQWIGFAGETVRQVSTVRETVREVVGAE